MAKRTLENCGHIRVGQKLNWGKPRQENGKCEGYKENGQPMFACQRCKLRGEINNDVQN